jgi:hypothetical protein
MYTFGNICQSNEIILTLVTAKYQSLVAMAKWIAIAMNTVEQNRIGYKRIQ